MAASVRFSLCTIWAPSPANVWKKLSKQSTVGYLGSVLIRNIFTHGVRLYITRWELWFWTTHCKQRSIAMRTHAVGAPDSPFPASCYVKLNHKLQTPPAPCLLGRASKCQLHSRFIFPLRSLLISKCQEIITIKKKRVQAVETKWNLVSCSAHFNLGGRLQHSTTWLCTDLLCNNLLLWHQYHRTYGKHFSLFIFLNTCFPINCVLEHLCPV